MRLVLEEQSEYPFLDFTAFDDPQRSVASLLKKNDVRRRLRRLAEQHEVAFEYDLAPTAVRMNQMFDLHRSRWDAKDGTMSGLFAGARRQAFSREVAERLAGCDLTRLSFVFADGQPIVGRFGFEFDHGYFGFKSGFDPQFAAFGPGHLIVGMLLEEAVARELRFFDFMRGAGDHKSQWATGTRDVGYWSLRRRDPRSRLDGLRMRWMLRRRIRDWTI
jgi:CelD/BcsL family acetyltransferase involved in cellulose biosynthesis